MHLLIYLNSLIILLSMPALCTSNRKATFGIQLVPAKIVVKKSPTKDQMYGVVKNASAPTTAVIIGKPLITCQAHFIDMFQVSVID